MSESFRNAIDRSPNGWFRGSTIERSYRDIRAATFHPLRPEQTLVHGGRLALGLPVDEL